MAHCICMSQASVSTEKPTHSLAVPSRGRIEQWVVELDEIHCQGCADDIRKFVWEHDGVHSVVADVATNQVKVVFEAPFSREKLLRILARAEFQLAVDKSPTLLLSEAAPVTSISA